MKYKIILLDEVVAEFIAREDAEYFLEYKRESLLNERNSSILARIREENNLQINDWISNDILFPYYARAKEQIKNECKMIEV